MNILPSDIPRDLSPYVAAWRRQNARLADLAATLELLAAVRKLQRRPMWSHPLEKPEARRCTDGSV